MYEKSLVISKNLRLEIGRSIKIVGEICVEQFIKKMLGIETYMKIYFKKDKEKSPGAII